MFERREHRRLFGALPWLWLAAACAGQLDAPPRAGGLARPPGGPGAPTLSEHPEERRDALTLDALHYGLSLRLEPEARALTGTLRVTFRATRPVARARFDAVGLEVRAARDGDGAPLPFEVVGQGDGGAVEVVLATPLAAGDERVLELDYAATPTKGLYFVGDPVDHCFTQGECNDARAWFPCIDHPSDRATSELVVDLPRAWTAVSGGERVEAREVGERRIERWRMDVPHPTYLTTLVAGELSRVGEVAGGIALEYVAPTRSLAGTRDVYGALLQESLGVTPEVLAFLEELTGRPYPFSKYATSCVDEFPFGGMENASATTITLAALRGPQGRRDGDATGLIVHEAAHQWFGDLLTCAEWPEIWLNEGFATYCSLLWTEAREGRQVFELAARDTVERYLDGDERTPRAIVHAQYRAPMDLFFSGHAYQGGASRLNLLRDRLGDGVFRAGLRRYVGRFQHRAVTTADLRAAFEEASGADLAAFFADWVLAPGHPVIDVASRWDEGGARALVRVEQVHAVEGGAPRAYRGVATLSWSVGGVVDERQVEVSERRHLFELPAASEPDWVVFDPSGVWPARVRHQRGTPERLRVARQHPSGVARREAVRELARGLTGEETPDNAASGANEAARRTDGPAGASDVFAALCSILAEDPLAPVRVAAAEALRDAPTSVGSIASVASALRLAVERAGEDARVRGAALNALALLVGGPQAGGELAGERASLAAFARALLADEAATFRVRGQAAELLLAADPDAGVDVVVAALAAHRPSGADPHGALGAQLVRALEVALGPLGARGPRGSAATSRAEEVLALVAGVALDDARPAAEREAAAQVLGAALGRAPRAFEALAELLTGRAAKLRRVALEALATSEDPLARGLLAEHLQRTTDPRERYVILGALAP